MLLMHETQGEWYKLWNPCTAAATSWIVIYWKFDPVPSATQSSSGLILLKMAIANITTLLPTVYLQCYGDEHQYPYQISTCPVNCSRSVLKLVVQDNCGGTVPCHADKFI